MFEDRHTTMGTNITMIDKVYKCFVSRIKLSSQTLKPLQQGDLSMTEGNIKHISDTYPLLQIFSNVIDFRYTVQPPL